MALTETLVYEQGDKVYLVAPVTPHEPSDEEIAGYDFADHIRKQATNPHIGWFAGHYVEGDKPNGNGAMWTSGELAIASVTPLLMPVTVMHDFRTAVGLIAGLKLSTPDGDQVPRSKIDTALALWKHRFPEVHEEAVHNYQSGQLMQSMECLAPRYDCSECGMGFVKLRQGAERANWCSHLLGESGEKASRTLRDVIFTGTGLIFGSRGATGADPKAHLETFQHEVAEFHQRVHTDTARPRSKRNMETIEIQKTEYAELTARPTRQELDDAKLRAEKAEGDVEKAEAAQLKAEETATELQKKVDAAEETARQHTLRDDRLKTLGEGFVAALGDKTKERLRSQAGVLADDEWTARLEELEELSGKKRDLGNAAADADKGTFSAEELARFGAGHDSGGHSDKQPSQVQRRSVLGGLTK